MLYTELFYAVLISKQRVCPSPWNTCSHNLWPLSNGFRARKTEHNNKTHVTNGFRQRDERICYKTRHKIIRNTRVSTHRCDLIAKVLGKRKRTRMYTWYIDGFQRLPNPSLSKDRSKDRSIEGTNKMTPERKQPPANKHCFKHQAWTLPRSRMKPARGTKTARSRQGTRGWMMRWRRGHQQKFYRTTIEHLREPLLERRDIQPRWENIVLSRGENSRLASKTRVNIHEEGISPRCPFAPAPILPLFTTIPELSFHRAPHLTWPVQRGTDSKYPPQDQNPSLQPLNP